MIVLILRFPFPYIDILLQAIFWGEAAGLDTTVPVSTTNCIGFRLVPRGFLFLFLLNCHAVSRNSSIISDSKKNDTLWYCFFIFRMTIFRIHCLVSNDIVKVFYCFITVLLSCQPINYSLSIRTSDKPFLTWHLLPYLSKISTLTNQGKITTITWKHHKYSTKSPDTPFITISSLWPIWSLITKHHEKFSNSQKSLWHWCEIYRP